MGEASVLRILMLNLEKSWRGGERQTMLTLERLQQAGHAVSLAARRGAPLAKRAAAAGIPVYEVANTVQLCGLLWRKRRGVDVYHAQTANTLTWLALLKPVLGGRLVFTRRTAFPVRRRERLTRWKWRQADALVPISAAAADEPKRLGVAVAAIIPSAVVFEPVSSDRLKSLRDELGLQGQKVVATVAALTAEKDVLTLIRAVHRLRQCRTDFVFLHIGAGGDQEEAAQALVSELGLQNTYRFAGFRTDVTDCYRLMDVFVLASAFEALGSSVLDAFLYRVPVVATQAGGLQALLAEGRGVSVGVGAHDQLAAGINRLLDRPALLEAMVERAADYVATHHDADRMARRYLEVYRQEPVRGQSSC